MKKLLIVLFILAAIGFGIFSFLSNWYDKAIFGGNEELAGEFIEYEVTEGATFTAVVEDLIEQGFGTNITAVKVYLSRESINPNIKVGAYSIPADANIPELIALLESGVVKPFKTVTIKEGLRYEQISTIFVEELSTTTQFNASEFAAIMENPDSYTFSPEIQTFLDTYKPAGKPLRGFLYPDTYNFEEVSTTQQIIEFMIQTFIDKVEANIDLTSPTSNQENFTDLYSGLILASIIDKEASAWDDRADISSVFHNRLQYDEILGSDATINFITGKNDAGVEIADIEQTASSPYNTYRNLGLPPTPINNPRIDSIIAALRPNITNYLFFYHTPDGETYYNETLYEHQQGVCRDLGC